jgi:hypothetical protein
MTSPLESVSELLSLVQDFGSGGNLIAIDGFMSSGKTTLAISLAEQLPAFRISLDFYVESERNAPNYIGLLRLADLASDIQKARIEFGSVVVEGICMLEVLDSIKVQPEIYVYVKRISPMGLWQDGFHFEDYETVGEECSFARLSELAYHASHRPHEISTVVYNRREG